MCVNLLYNEITLSINNGLICQPKLSNLLTTFLVSSNFGLLIFEQYLQHNKIGFRIIVKNVDDCYKTLGVFHNKFSSIPGKFKDYISSPKINGYKSIHTSVIGPKKIQEKTSYPN